MNKTLVALYLLTALDPAACHCGGAPSIPSDLEIAPPTVSFWDPTPPSLPIEEQTVNAYSADFASGSRNSRVQVPYRSVGQLTRFVPLEETPWSVTLDPLGRYVGAALPESYAIWTTESAKVLSGDRSAGEPVYFSESGVVLDGEYKVWGAGKGRYIDPAWNRWVVRERSGQLAYVAVWPRRPVDPHGLMVGPDVVLATTAMERGDGRGYDEFAESLVGRTGCGAIAADNRIAVAWRGTRFLVVDAFRASSRPDPKPVRLVDEPLEIAPYDMSIVEGGYALLDATLVGDESIPRSPVAEAWARKARVLDIQERLVPQKPPRWWTSLHLLGPEGRQRSRVDVKIEVYMPPVDAGDGRIYLFGEGIAAVQDGKVLFVTPSKAPMFGTAFDGGTLAVSAGPELRIVDRDGKVLQRLPTPEHEEITTPPAIGADGAIWVGTPKALYVARPAK